MPCLPDPIPPDLDRYIQIVSLIIFCWIMTFFEPYGLRLRHVVMCYYHPDRAKQRAVWLYNHIIRYIHSIMNPICSSCVGIHLIEFWHFRKRFIIGQLELWKNVFVIRNFYSRKPIYIVQLPWINCSEVSDSTRSYFECVVEFPLFRERSRGNFLKFARRQLRRRFSKSEKSKIEKVTCKERMVAICPILRHCFGSDKPMCLLCGEVERESQPPLIKCPKPLCTGLFCVQCFADLQNLCTICLEPIDYGDLSDMSEERWVDAANSEPVGHL